MMVNLVNGTLMGAGIDVTDLGLATTPTVEMAVPAAGAAGGIIVTASHNPGQWNALKLLNEKGEFLSAADGQRILELAEDNSFKYVGVENLGTHTRDYTWLEHHIRRILEMPLVDAENIRRSGFKVAFDAVNSVGGIALPMLLEALGVSSVVAVNATPDGKFTHNPEPLPEHLGDFAAAVKKSKSDIGFVVDPDVDRLAVVMENGRFFGEEYTLVAVADYVLGETPGNTVSNLSSTRALRDVTEKHGGKYFASAVGEVNVVEMMKACNAVIGGEGNGGVIYPELHYGRDALAGIALFLSHLAASKLTCSALRAKYPDYYMSKNKVEIKPGAELNDIFQHVREKYSGEALNETDGLKIDFSAGWVHLRQSNTEPIIRIYAESTSHDEAEALARSVIQDISPWVC
jgi:phosphomannomutase